MTTQEKSKNLDKILSHLIEGRGQSFNVGKIAEMLNVDYDTSFHLIDILVEEDVIDFFDTSSKNGKDKIIYINSNGVVVFKSEGGFTRRFETQEQNRIKEEELKNLQLVDLKSRVEHLEKTIKNQREFWTSSTERNKEQIPFLKDKRLVAWVALGIALFNVIIAVYILTK